MEEEEAKRIFTQLINGLNYLHNMNIAHRDIKLENILLDDSKNVKIIDYGFSVFTFPDRKLNVFCGTPSKFFQKSIIFRFTKNSTFWFCPLKYFNPIKDYMAPELLQRKEYYGAPVDIWACGIVLYVMLCGTFPYKASSDSLLYE